MANDITAELMKYVAELAEKAKSPEIFQAPESPMMYCDQNGDVQTIMPPEEPGPDSLTTFSLQGLVDFLKSGADSLICKYGHLYANVVSPTKVHVFTPLTGQNNTRYNAVACIANLPSINFNAYMDMENFVIMLMTRFEPTQNRDILMSLASRTKTDEGVETADDGLSQKVVVKQGVATSNQVTVTNPCMLRARRTFLEVEQPEVPYVVRFRKGDDGAHAALFEADGGAWQHDAVQNIAAWLREQLHDIPEIIIIA